MKAKALVLVAIVFFVSGGCNKQTPTQQSKQQTATDQVYENMAVKSWATFVPYIDEQGRTRIPMMAKFRGTIKINGVKYTSADEKTIYMRPALWPIVVSSDLQESEEFGAVSSTCWSNGYTVQSSYGVTIEPGGLYEAVLLGGVCQQGGCYTQKGSFLIDHEFTGQMYMYSGFQSFITNCVKTSENSNTAFFGEGYYTGWKSPGTSSQFAASFTVPACANPSVNSVHGIGVQNQLPPNDLIIYMFE